MCDIRLRETDWKAKKVWDTFSNQLGKKAFLKHLKGHHWNHSIHLLKLKLVHLLESWLQLVYTEAARRIWRICGRCSCTFGADISYATGSKWWWNLLDLTVKILVHKHKNLNILRHLANAESRLSASFKARETFKCHILIKMPHLERISLRICIKYCSLLLLHLHHTCNNHGKGQFGDRRFGDGRFGNHRFSDGRFGDEMWNVFSFGMSPKC